MSYKKKAVMKIVLYSCHICVISKMEQHLNFLFVKLNLWSDIKLAFLRQKKRLLKKKRSKFS